MVLTRMKKLLCMCLLVLLCLSGTAQGQPALNEPVYLMVQGQLMEQLQVLHSGPRTCTHPSFALEKQEAPDELLCLPLSNFYHRIVTPCEAVCTLCGQHCVVVTASESRQPHHMQLSGDVRQGKQRQEIPGESVSGRELPYCSGRRHALS